GRTPAAESDLDDPFRGSDAKRRLLRGPPDCQRPPTCAEIALRMRRTNLLALLGLAAFALGAARCNGDPASEASAVRPLFDGLHAPDLLTEAGALELPPSLGGNRFLAGWI